MSAYIVDDDHISFLLTGAIYGAVDTCGPRVNVFPHTETGPGMSLLACEENADQIGQALLNQNYVSVNARYGESDEAPHFIYRRGTRGTSVELLKAVAGYRYQACEDSGWRTSFANLFCGHLQTAIIYGLPGYSEAHTWNVVEPLERDATGAHRLRQQNPPGSASGEDGMGWPQ